MRVTNNMITSNTKNNINSNKVFVDKYNTQMTTQKKIDKPSDDPVIAIRSLRMQTSLRHIDQYLTNNIADVESWLEITDTALENMTKILTDAHTLCVHGSTDTLTQDDRKTILKQLTAMSDQIYAEGNADYAGRTVFTGYRTSSQLTFKTDEQDTTYQIEQNFTYKDLEERRYYYGSTEVPADASIECTTKIGEKTYNRIRLAYDNINGEKKADGTTAGTVIGYQPAATETDPSPAFVENKILINGKEVDITNTYETAEDWSQAIAAGDPLASDDPDNPKVAFIKETGELIFTSKYANELSRNNASINVSYTKTGFDAGEARPEYYYNCTMQKPDMDAPVKYTKENQQINFEISNGIMLPANTQASEVLSTDIGRDMNEMIDIVNTAINAHDKVDQIKHMMSLAQYEDEDSQKMLQTYLDAAEKEADYADDNLKKTYKQYLTNFSGYMEKVNIAHTNVGSLKQRLDLTKTRVENQQATVSELKSNNDNRDISDIIIDYYAAYNAYTSSLTAASKIGSQTLLNYL